MRFWIFFACSCVLAVFACLPDVELVSPVQPNACGDGVVQISLGEECDPADGSIGCTSDCRLSCDGGAIDPRTNHCYFTALSTGSHDTGKNDCAKQAAHLVTFASIDELAFVMTRTGIDGGAWIDLQRQPALPFPSFKSSGDDPGWGKQCPGCYANINPVNIGYFPIVEGGIDGPCVALSTLDQRTWFALPCDLNTTTLAVVCEREPPGKQVGPCDAGTCAEIAPTIGESAYVVFGNPVSYADAKSTCAAIPKGRLVVLESREEREELARSLASANIKDFWIGLEWNGSGFVWLDGQGIDGHASPWGDREPDAGAGSAWIAVDTNYDTRHAHTGGANVHPFVCEIKLR